jgi:hypothetical protein
MHSIITNHQTSTTIADHTNALHNHRETSTTTVDQTNALDNLHQTSTITVDQNNALDNHQPSNINYNSRPDKCTPLPPTIKYQLQ